MKRQRRTGRTVDRLAAPAAGVFVGLGIALALVRVLGGPWAAAVGLPLCYLLFSLLRPVPPRRRCRSC